MSKPNCFKCRHKGNIPGNAHIKCDHPMVADNELFKVAALLRVGVRALGQKPDGDIFPPLNIKGNKYGIEKGWLVWPVDFDPVWLENCKGFKEDE